MRIFILLGMMVLATQAKNSAVLNILQKVRIGNCEGGCQCPTNGTNALQVAEAKLAALQGEADALNNQINNAETANSSVSDANESINNLTSALNSSNSGRRYKRQSTTANLSSCEDPSATLSGDAASVTTTVINGIIAALETVATTLDSIKLDCYSGLAQQLTQKFNSGSLAKPADVTSLLSLAQTATSKSAAASSALANKINDLVASLAAKEAEITAQKAAVIAAGGTVAEITTVGLETPVAEVSSSESSTKYDPSSTYLTKNPTESSISIPPNNSSAGSSTMNSSESSLSISSDNSTYGSSTDTSSSLQTIPATKTMLNFTCQSTSTTTTTLPPSTTSATQTSLANSSKCTIATLFSDNCWSNSPVNTRIVGGGPALPNHYPYQIGYAEGTKVVCGGSILTSTWVITAAHCVYDMETGELSSDVNIYYNSINRGVGPFIQASRIFVHPNYSVNTNPSYYENDIALVELCEPLDFSLPGVKPVCFGKSDTNFNGTVIATGWGDLKEGSVVGSDVLQEVVLNIITEDQCKDFSNNLNGFTVPPSNGSYVCTYTSGKDTCQGDSGGPIVGEVSPGCWLLLGVTSYGKGCAEESSPGIYTKVSAFKDWICQTTTLC